MSELEIAIKAVEIYAARHPVPSHVNQSQACEMLGLSAPTVRKMVRSGNLKLNKCGLIPVTEIYKSLAISEAVGL